MMFKHLPEKVNIVEVGPRDGLQNEEVLISTKDKITLINKLSDSGLKNIELTAFVHPKWSPQLADSYDVAIGVNKLSDVNYTALIPNMKGLDRAESCALKEVAIISSASESHSKKNLNRSIDETLEIVSETVKEARARNIKIRAYLSTVFGCPYEGNVSIDRVKEIVKKLLSMDIYQISLGDTIGIANPLQVRDILNGLFNVIEDKSQLALHFHDTRGLGLANALVGLEMGITTFDSSIGGLGGCPYAPGATGNISTEDLVNMFETMGVYTGVNLPKLVDANLYLESLVNRSLNSRFSKTFNATNRVPV
ncbi:MAG: hydroxymethylglutaryl-CoA lyase [Candidatus Sericytochromatia bacterium]